MLHSGPTIGPVRPQLLRERFAHRESPDSGVMGGWHPRVHSSKRDEASAGRMGLRPDSRAGRVRAGGDEEGLAHLLLCFWFPGVWGCWVCEKRRGSLSLFLRPCGGLCLLTYQLHRPSVTNQVPPSFPLNPVTAGEQNEAFALWLPGHVDGK